MLVLDSYINACAVRKPSDTFQIIRILSKVPRGHSGIPNLDVTIADPCIVSCSKVEGDNAEFRPVHLASVGPDKTDQKDGACQGGEQQNKYLVIW